MVFPSISGSTFSKCGSPSFSAGNRDDIISGRAEAAAPISLANLRESIQNDWKNKEICSGSVIGGCVLLLSVGFYFSVGQINNPGLKSPGFFRTGNPVFLLS
jgi:hypothetical protein